MRGTALKNKKFSRDALLPLSHFPWPYPAPLSRNPDFPWDPGALVTLTKISGTFRTVTHCQWSLHNVTMCHDNVRPWPGEPGENPPVMTMWKGESLHNVNKGKLWQMSLRRRGGFKMTLFLDLIKIPYPRFEEHLAQLAWPMLVQCETLAQWQQRKHSRKYLCWWCKKGLTLWNVPFTMWAQYPINNVNVR